jgi:hypothetical protein
MFHWLTMMYGQRVESSSLRSNDDSNRFGPAGVSLPHDKCRWRTYTHQHLLESSKIGTGLALFESIVHCVVRPDGFTWACYMVLLSYLYSQCVVVVSHKGIAKILGLPEHVANTSKVLTTHRPTTNGPKSTQAGSLRQASNLTQVKIPPGLDLTKLTSWYSQTINRVKKSKLKLLLSNDETIVRLSS